MCRFKRLEQILDKKGKKVSIHPMCRFKYDFTPNWEEREEFQYILCVGSSGQYAKIAKTPGSFNTSYVSVQEQFLL